MEYLLLYAVVQVLLAPFTYKHYQKAMSEPPTPKTKRVLQSDQYKTQQAVTPLSKRGLKPSRPNSEPPKPGVQMVGGRAVLIKSAAAVEPVVVKTAAQGITVPPPPPPPSIHSKLNPVKPAPAPVVPVQWGPTPLPQKEGIDVPTRVLVKLDSYTYDRAISTRLVMNVAQKHPDRDGTWCAEKALWDIERDRQ